MADEQGTQGTEKKAPATPEQRLKIIEDVTFEIIDKLEKLTERLESLSKDAVTKPKGLFGGKRVPVPIKDLQTGEVYPSMSAVNKVFGPEIGIDPYEDTMGYYKIAKKLLLEDGTARFVAAPEDEAKKAREKYEAEVQAEIDKKNAELQAEQGGEEDDSEEEKPKPASSGKKK